VIAFQWYLGRNKSFTGAIKYGIYITVWQQPRNTQQAAKAAGIAVMTLQPLDCGQELKAPKLRIRNGRAVRLWSKADLDRLRKLKQEIYCKGRGRKKGYKSKKRDALVLVTPNAPLTTIDLYWRPTWLQVSGTSLSCPGAQI